MKTIKDYSLKPVLTPDWFLFSTSTETFDLEREYYSSMSKIMKVVNHKKKEDWEKLVELGFHEFNINLMINSNIIFDYYYESMESKNVIFLFDSLADGKLNPEQFIEYTIRVRQSLEKEISTIAKRVYDEILISGLLFVINETNNQIHSYTKTTPIFYRKEMNEMSLLSFRVSDNFPMFLNYSHMIDFSGEDCAKKFTKFVKNKSAFFDKASSMIIYTLSTHRLDNAAGLFYAIYMFNTWLNSDVFNPHIIGDVLANIDTLDYCLSFSADV